MGRNLSADLRLVNGLKPTFVRLAAGKSPLSADFDGSHVLVVRINRKSPAAEYPSRESRTLLFRADVSELPTIRNGANNIGPLSNSAIAQPRLMNRRRKPPPKKASASRPGPMSLDDGSQKPEPPAGDGNDESPMRSNRSPSFAIKVGLSVWLAFHLLALTVTLTSVVEPSASQTQLQQLLQFYLYPTHFLADARPIYLAHANTAEQPHRLQVTRVDPAANPSLFRLPIDDASWETVDPPGAPGLAGNDRYSRWLSTAATLAQNEQPSLVAELLLPAALNDRSIKAVRIVRLPTQLTTTADDALLPPYSAYVATKNNSVSLVQVNEPRLSTTQRAGDNE